MKTQMSKIGLLLVVALFISVVVPSTSEANVFKTIGKIGAAPFKFTFSVVKETVKMSVDVGKHVVKSCNSPMSAYTVWFSLDGTSPYVCQNEHPIDGMSFKFTVAWRCPKNMTLSRAEFSPDGTNWYPVAIGYNRTMDRILTSEIRNTHSGEVQTITIRGWFTTRNQGIDPSTGRPYPDGKMTVGPFYANLDIQHI